MLTRSKRWLAGRMRRALALDEDRDRLLAGLRSIEVRLEERAAALEARLEARLAAIQAGTADAARAAADAARDSAATGREAAALHDLRYRDLLLAVAQASDRPAPATIRFEAARRVAADSDDHRIPWGAAHDNTRSPRFVAACERHFPGRRPLQVMDLGCSGGGLVLDFTLRGHHAFGVEGSDGPLRAQRAEWRVLPDRLFTADITRPFRLHAAPGAEALLACDVISAWEVMEHIEEADIAAVFENVRAHLKPDGMFVGSIALVPDDHPETGARYHRTVRPQAWWEERFAALGLPMRRDHGFAFEDFCRGTGNGAFDPNFREDPTQGFHFVAGPA